MMASWKKPKGGIGASEQLERSIAKGTCRAEDAFILIAVNELQNAALRIDEVGEFLHLDSVNAGTAQVPVKPLFAVAFDFLATDVPVVVAGNIGDKRSESCHAANMADDLAVPVGEIPPLLLAQLFAVDDVANQIKFIDGNVAEHLG